MATWQFDPTHTQAGFSARHMMITTVRGRFDAAPTGVLVFDPENPASASVEASIDVASINTNMTDRDNHLKSPDFLDVATYPTITFKSTAVAMIDETRANVTGDLTICGVTRPVVLATEFIGSVNSPMGDERAGFVASTKINREDFGLTWNMALEAGGWLVGKEITITLDVEAIRVVETESAS